MPDVMRIEIVDDAVEDGQCWLFDIPLEGASISKIGAAIETLYPNAIDIRIYLYTKED